MARYRLLLALLTCSAQSDKQLPTADLLIPQNEADYSNMLSALMEQQLKILQGALGADHAQVSLASTLVDLQKTVRAALRPPLFLLMAHAWLVLLQNVDLMQCTSMPQIMHLSVAINVLGNHACVMDWEPSI